MAKVEPADVRKAEIEEQWRREVGKAVGSVQAGLKLSLKEFSDLLKRDARQVARWIDGKEHAQIAVIFAVPACRCLLVLSLAKLAGEGVAVKTVITLDGAA